MSGTELEIAWDPADVQNRLSNLAAAKGVDISDLVNELLKKDLELIETAT